jgi:hypothetical protein
MAVKISAAASVPTGEAVLHAVMMDDRTYHEKDNQRDEQALPPPARAAIVHDNGFFSGGRGSWGFGHKRETFEAKLNRSFHRAFSALTENDTTNTRAVTV